MRTSWLVMGSLSTSATMKLAERSGVASRPGDTFKPMRGPVLPPARKACACAPSVRAMARVSQSVRNMI